MDYKWLGLVLIVVCLHLGWSKPLEHNFNDKDLEECRKRAHLDKKSAISRLNPKIIPEIELEMCFLQCYYLKNPVSVTGNYELKVNNDKTLEVYVNDDVTKGNKNNSIVTACYQHALPKDDPSSCAVGLIIRLCHQQYSRVVTQLLAAITNWNQK